MSDKNNQFLMFDDRAMDGDTESASILDTADDLDDVAEANRAHEGEGYVWYEVERVTGVIGAMRPDLHDFGLSRKRRKRNRKGNRRATP